MRVLMYVPSMERYRAITAQIDHADQKIYNIYIKGTRRF